MSPLRGPTTQASRDPVAPTPRLAWSLFLCGMPGVPYHGSRIFCKARIHHGASWPSCAPAPPASALLLPTARNALRCPRHPLRHTGDALKHLRPAASVACVLRRDLAHQCCGTCLATRLLGHIRVHLRPLVPLAASASLGLAPTRAHIGRLVAPGKPQLFLTTEFPRCASPLEATPTSSALGRTACFAGRKC